MEIQFGREISGDRQSSASREWLVTNGIGGYASGTVAGLLTRCYHGLLIAALSPPLGRTLLVTKIDEVAHYGADRIELSTNRWSDGTLTPQGFQHIEHFSLDGTSPVWQFAFADVRLEKRIWMQPGANTTYVQYTLHRASQPVRLTFNGLFNYRDHHSRTQGHNWQMDIAPVESGVCVTAYPDATPVYLLSSMGTATPTHTWHYGFDLAIERDRGLVDRDDHLHGVTFDVTLEPGASVTLVASVHPHPILNSHASWQTRRDHEHTLVSRWQNHESYPPHPQPDWVRQLVLAADQFIVDRPLPDNPHGKTIIAGYHWFGDWGRDTMISLPGLTLSTGRPEIARSILYTFAQYVDQGMLPNRFPDGGESPEYNTVDATLWYFEATRLYYAATDDEDLLQALFPVLADIIDWHCRGTRYAIHLDSADGLLYAGTPGVQLTWMDAKVGDWVVTPRVGKPVEVNVLWYNALRTMAKFARQLSKPHQEYDAIANRTLARFDRFWHETNGYCYDVIDGPDGDDASLRPNQLFAVSLPLAATGNGHPPLLSPRQQRQVVDACGQALLTSYGLRSLSANYPHYHGHYGGDQLARDGAYHQGTTWGWLLGAFAIAHMRVYGDAAAARSILSPMADHLSNHGLGSLSEIFDGDPPFNPRGCIAQAWTVAEILRAWTELA